MSWGDQRGITLQKKLCLRILNNSVDHDYRLEEAHNRHYQLLTEKYSHKKIAEIWKPFTTINGLFMPDYYSIEGPTFNPDVLDKSLFIQVALLKITGSEPACSNNWYIYDSLNNPGYYLYTIKNVPNRINVSKQNGSIDCGLFALGYALALALDIDTGPKNFKKVKKCQNSQKSSIFWNFTFYFGHSLGWLEYNLVLLFSRVRTHYERKKTHGFKMTTTFFILVSQTSNLIKN
ncbi:hypothetical protein BpHYR1_041701 [Brachionus plicatilis]|uniref:Uncharacterized protein n=1 Tax=Brachionus plicatilis TaxID=10195 RepID=A0A3M7Q871_BRAPC|nr:hypothetical protein BpHYR1_041701 [Brachionus plicatilis]